MTEPFDLYDELPPLEPVPAPSLLDSFAPVDPFTPFAPVDVLQPLDPVPPPELLVPQLFDVGPLPAVDPHEPGSLVDAAGNASASDDHWHSQGNEQGCAVVAQGSIIEEVTGWPFDLEKAGQWLSAQGWYDPATGTAPQDCGRLLDAYGIAHTDGPASVEQLYDALQRGDHVMVALDANEIWYPQEGPDGRPLDQPGSSGHAVRVTEIGCDPVDGEWKVVVNDSAHPGGRANTLDLADFLQATDDFGGFSVIVDSDSYDGRRAPFEVAS